jgi:Ca2+-binding RTX toxin-like protein
MRVLPIAVSVGLVSMLAAAVPVADAGAARPRCFGKRATIVGSERSDTITGTPKADVIVGNAGTDSIDGRGGNDRICAGPGGLHREFLEVISGGEGRDRLGGGPGLDHLKGMRGADLLRAGKGDYDFLGGGAGTDRLFGGLGAFDDFNGGRGSDLLRGGAGRDRWYDDPGDDRFFGGLGSDDAIMLAGRRGGGDDVIHGGHGEDGGTFGLYGANDALTVNLARGVAKSKGIGTDRISDLENAWSICDPCVLIGDEHANDLESHLGDDIIKGLGSNDTIFSSSGSDILRAGGGNDDILPYSGDDVIAGGPGRDEVGFRNSSRGIQADLRAGTATGEGRDSLVAGQQRRQSLVGTWRRRLARRRAWH